MKTKNFKRPIALFLAVMLCASLLFSLGTTAFAAEETANVCLIAFPRDGDANYNGEWGHGNLNFMNGWSTTVLNPAYRSSPATASQKKEKIFGITTPPLIIKLFLLRI